MRTALLVLGLAVVVPLSACGGDDADPHAAATCMNWQDNLGNPFTGTCEAACEAPPEVTGETCDTTVRAGCPSFSFSGTEGCCITESTAIKFYECQ